MSVRVCHMINFHERGKMLREFLIFSLCFVAINAAGQFQVVGKTKGISFEGSDPLPGEYVSDIFNVALGNTPQPDADWPAMTITDPFKLPRNGILVQVAGIDKVAIDGDVHSFDLVGSVYDDELSDLGMTLRSHNYKNCDIKQGEPLTVYNHCFMESLEEAPVQSAKKLRRPSDKPFLQMLGLIQSITDNIDAITGPETFLRLRIDLTDIVSTYGPESEAVNEAKSLLSSALTELTATAQTSFKKGVFIGVATSAKKGERTKREVVPPTAKDNPFNLAEYYNQDYPVIFNIILWFMIVFGLSLVAICYAIGAMDPGRDSIIYRMTSTRMKKDN